MKTPIKLILTIISISFLVSCSRNPSAVLDNLDCQPPCWRDIQVGLSQPDEVMDLLEAMTDIQINTIETSKTPIKYMEEEVGWEFVEVSEYSGEVYFQERKASMIHFGIIIGMDNNIPLRDFISQYGEPSLLYLQSEKLDGVYMSVRLIYPQQGICLVYQPIVLPFQEPKTYSVKPSMRIGDVYYVDPAISPTQLLVGCLRGMPEEEFDAHVQQWEGYGKYPVYRR